MPDIDIARQRLRDNQQLPEEKGTGVNEYRWHKLISVSGVVEHFAMTL